MPATATLAKNEWVRLQAPYHLDGGGRARRGDMGYVERPGRTRTRVVFQHGSAPIRNVDLARLPTPDPWQPPWG